MPASETWPAASFARAAPPPDRTEPVAAATTAATLSPRVVVLVFIRAPRVRGQVADGWDSDEEQRRAHVDASICAGPDRRQSRADVPSEPRCVEEPARFDRRRRRAIREAGALAGGRLERSQ